MSEEKTPTRVKPSTVPSVQLTVLQNDFVTELVRDNKPNLWNWRKYLKGIAVGVGYSPMAIDKLKEKDKVWFAARSLVNNLPVDIEVLPDENRPGSITDPDKDRKPGQPLISLRQERYCQELIADPAMNKRKAAKRAGYSGEGEWGWKLWQMPKIQTRVEELQAERKASLKADQEEVIGSLVRLARINMADYVDRFDGQSIQFEDSNELSRDQMYGIKRIKQTIRGVGQNAIETFSITLEDKQRALALLAQHLGLLDKEVSFDPREFATQIRQLSKDISTKVPGGEL